MRLILNHHDGVTTYYRGKTDDGKVIVETVQDCQGVVDRNKRAQSMGRQRGEFQHWASIPAIIWNKWMIDDGVNLNKMPNAERSVYLRRKLNDPDWKWLKPVDEVV